MPKPAGNLRANEYRATIVSNHTAVRENGHRYLLLEITLQYANTHFKLRLAQTNIGLAWKEYKNGEHHWLIVWQYSDQDHLVLAPIKARIIRRIKQLVDYYLKQTKDD